MFTSFIQAHDYYELPDTAAGDLLWILSDDSPPTQVDSAFRSAFLTFECATGKPTATKYSYYEGSLQVPLPDEPLSIFGDDSGVMVVPFTLSSLGNVWYYVKLSKAVTDVKLYPSSAPMYLAMGKTIGPVSLTSGAFDTQPFSVVLCAKPLFLDPVPYIEWYLGPGTATSTVAVDWETDQIGEYSHVVVADAIEKKIRIRLKYAVDNSNIGKVTAAIRLIDAEATTCPQYTLAAEFTVGLPTGTTHGDVVIGAENPAEYTKRRYVPRIGRHDTMNFEPIQPVVLTVDDIGEVQASGRILYEHSALLVDEPPCTKYLVYICPFSGSGTLSIFSDPYEYAELSEYECS